MSVQIQSNHFYQHSYSALQKLLFMERSCIPKQREIFAVLMNVICKYIDGHSMVWLFSNTVKPALFVSSFNVISSAFQCNLTTRIILSTTNHLFMRNQIIFRFGYSSITVHLLAHFRGSTAFKILENDLFSILTTTPFLVKMIWESMNHLMVIQVHVTSSEVSNYQVLPQK